MNLDQKIYSKSFMIIYIIMWLLCKKRILYTNNLSCNGLEMDTQKPESYWSIETEFLEN